MLHIVLWFVFKHQEAKKHFHDDGLELNFNHKQIQGSGMEGYADLYLKLKWNKKLAENEAKENWKKVKVNDKLD